MIKPTFRVRGFTLVEMIVTLVILAILAAVAIPSFTQMLHRGGVSSASNALLADLAYARTEAVSRHTNVSVCPTTTGNSCAANPAYDSGWLIYTYTPGHAVSGVAYDKTSADNTILRWTKARDGVSIQAKSSSVISYGQQGQVSSGSTAADFYVCYRPKGDTGTGSSTASVRGSEVKVGSSGSVVTSNLGTMSSCVPG